WSEVIATVLEAHLLRCDGKNGFDEVSCGVFPHSSIRRRSYRGGDRGPANTRRRPSSGNQRNEEKSNDCRFNRNDHARRSTVRIGRTGRGPGRDLFAPRRSLRSGLKEGRSRKKRQHLRHAVV